jgi:D-glycero-alpha-D-manno-heptose-7-phosphate kinase
MIVSCAPFRVSFAGGGSDIGQFYRQKRGAVLSCSIAQYSFAIVHPYFNDQKYHLKYSRTELADSLNDVQHPLLREALRMRGIEPGIEVTSVADIPSGTGLGSSSSFAVALLNALYAHQSVFASKETLARDACALEIERLGEPIGKQDQYAAAYGGINFIQFHPDESVTVQPLTLPKAVMAELEAGLMLFYTGDQRDTRTLLSRQMAVMQSDQSKFDTMSRMVDLAHRMRDLLVARDLNGFGTALHEGWEMKRSLADGISQSRIDDWYAKARAAGAIGGKLAGAGGGGFLLIYAPPAKQAAVRAALGELKTVEFRFDQAGARIAFAQ